MEAAIAPYASLCEVAAAVRRGSCSASELLETQLRRIQQLDPQLNSVASLNIEAARLRAKQCDEAQSKDQLLGPLHGVPIGIKDNIATEDSPTACGTSFLASVIPRDDAHVVRRLRNAGAVILCKTRMAEGGYAEHLRGEPVPRNPWNRAYWTGVSSSGSAVAVAAGLCFASLGTDTGGSIRLPAAACGLTGLKPTYGRVSRAGVYPLCESLDHVGAIARCAEDAAVILDVISGCDQLNTGNDAAQSHCRAALRTTVAGIRLGLDYRLIERSVDPAVAAAVVRAVRQLEVLGVRVLDVALSPVLSLLPGYLLHIGSLPEIASAHATVFAAHKNDYGQMLREAIEQAELVNPQQLARASEARQQFTAAFASVLNQVDLILLPTLPWRIPKLTEVKALLDGSDKDGLTMGSFVGPFNASGHPAVSLPCGFSEDGLPLSLELVGPHSADELLCQVGHAYQCSSNWHLRRPPVD